MGIFSGLSGAFLAGATEKISANWKEDREKMEAMPVEQRKKQLKVSMKMPC